MSSALKVLLMWSLSPLGTLLNTGLLVLTLVLAGADVHGASFWLPVALFVGVSGFFDVSAYLVQRRKGLTSYEVAEAVFERVWGSSDRDGSR